MRDFVGVRCINTATPGPPCTPGGLVENHSHQKLCDERCKRLIDLRGEMWVSHLRTVRT